MRRAGGSSVSSGEERARAGPTWFATGAMVVLASASENTVEGDRLAGPDEPGPGPRDDPPVPRKSGEHLGDNPRRKVTISRERLRQILDANEVTWQATKTWKESNDPDKEAKVDRDEEVLDNFADRVLAFDEFGPPALHPIGGCCLAAEKRQQRPGVLGQVGFGQRPDAEPMI